MVTSELLVFIRSELGKGVSQSNIKQNLLVNKLTVEDIDSAFCQLLQPNNRQNVINGGSNITEEVVKKQPSGKVKIGLAVLIVALIIVGVFIVISKTSIGNKSVSLLSKKADGGCIPEISSEQSTSGDSGGLKVILCFDSLPQVNKSVGLTLKADPQDTILSAQTNSRILFFLPKTMNLIEGNTEYPVTFMAGKQLTEHITVNVPGDTQILMRGCAEINFRDGVGSICDLLKVTNTNGQVAVSRIGAIDYVGGP